MKSYFENLARALLGLSWDELGKAEQQVIESIAEAETLVENVNLKFHDQLTFGQRVADKISTFGGSWTFIIMFILILVFWMILNSWYLVGIDKTFDPYPYILLNLILSTLAALQAPVIMMSQNRQSAKDRLDIHENYKISLRTDLEIIRLHQKLDDLNEILSKRDAGND